MLEIQMGAILLPNLNYKEKIKKVKSQDFYIFYSLGIDDINEMLYN